MALLLVLLSIPALADEFIVTGQTDPFTCTKMDSQCPSVTFTLDLNAEYVPPSDEGIDYRVVSFTGTIDGEYSISGIGGGLRSFAPAATLIPWDPLIFTIESQQDFIGWDDLNAGSSFIQMTPTSAGSLGGPAFVTWSIAKVPEPSSLLFGGIGLMCAWLLPRRHCPTCKVSS